jgi:hypothetical protein
MTSPVTISCPACKTAWPIDSNNPALALVCPGCQREAGITFFPAFAQPSVVTGAAPEKIVVEGEASCFYHADKRAVIPCGACGRFLCALCDVVVGERHLCPGCIESGRARGRFVEFETSRTLWDSAALTLAAGPLLVCFYISIITAPAAIAVALVGWKKPGSIIPRSRWRYWLAILLGVVEIAGWVIFFVYAARGSFWFHVSR